MKVPSKNPNSPEFSIAEQAAERNTLESAPIALPKGVVEAVGNRPYSGAALTKESVAELQNQHVIYDQQREPEQRGIRTVVTSVTNALQEMLGLKDPSTPTAYKGVLNGETSAAVENEKPSVSVAEAAGGISLKGVLYAVASVGADNKSPSFGGIAKADEPAIPTPAATAHEI
ncbi:MAG: hypothetical protein EBR02_05000 [Alphaproteobacteria bacterium]|nr:hypothetical protein [Alphaproteobacteria bacterium]